MNAFSSRLSFVALVALVGCGGGSGSGAVPLPPASSPAPQSVSVRFAIAIPLSADRAPAFVSTATRSVAMTVTPAGGGIAASVTVNCTSVCDGTIAAPVGSDTFAIEAYSGQDASGNILSQGSVTQTIVVGHANTVIITMTADLGVRVSGNRLVDAGGDALTLRGVDVSATEYVCAQGWSSDPYGGAPLADPATFQAMQAWDINVIRIPLNEDCWLNINGVTVGGATYQAAIADEVSAAHRAGMYVILDLHWSAPGTQLALGQNPVPDEDHSPAFWSSVATSFKDDPGVIFDLFNEPFDYWGTNPDPWAGWLGGDTYTQYVTGGANVTADWRSAGMQQLIDVIRATGATQPLLVNGLDWSNDDGGWLAHKPTDPNGQLIVGAHIYPGNACDTATCWDGVYPAIEASYPVLIGETGDSTGAPVSSFLPAFLTYADANHWNYLAWTWDVWDNPDFVLIGDWDGTPTSGEGATYKAHLIAERTGSIHR